MEGLSIHEVTSENWRTTLRLAVHPEQQRFISLQLTLHPENHRAQHLYLGAGFRPIGTELDGEPVYRLAFSDFQDAQSAYQAIEPRYQDANRHLAEQA